MQATLQRALLPRGEADDPRLMSRALGVMLLCGGIAVLVGAMLTPPKDLDVVGFQAVGLVGITVGAGAIALARHAHVWTAHALCALGSCLICLGIYFTGAATGLYGVLLVWLAVFAAGSFSPRAVAAHIAWIMAASAGTLAMLGSTTGPPAVARWTVGGVLLTVVAMIVGRIAARRRASEARLRSEIAERERLQRELEHLADHDPLTGVANRRRLEQDLARELARARRQGSPLCLVTIDLDDLKGHNDTYGHAAGDRLLKHVATKWSAALRTTDLLARTGGDEFVVLLPGCTAEMAERVIEKLQKAVEPRCRCSAGAAVWDGWESGADLQVRADLAMYDAKVSARRSGPSVKGTSGGAARALRGDVALTAR